MTARTKRSKVNNSKQQKKKKKPVSGGSKKKTDDEEIIALRKKKKGEEQQQQQQQQEVESSSMSSSSDDDSHSTSSSSSSDDQDDKNSPAFTGRQLKKKEEAEGGDSDDSSSSESSSSESSDDSSSNSSSSGDDIDDSNTKKNDDVDVPVFSDKNASWLKPKKKSDLLPSDDDEEEEESSEDGGQQRRRRKQKLQHSDDDDDEEEEELEIERESRVVDEEMEVERMEAEEEMQRTVREDMSVYHLPTPEETGRGADGEYDSDVAPEDRVIAPSEIKSHVDSILEVLADFKTRREPGRARKEYVDQLGHYISELYGYLPELVEYFLTMFGPTETLEFVHQSDQPRPLVIRTNTLKARRKDLAAALIKRGVTLDPLSSWSKVGLKIVESPVPIGATPEYLSGMYMLQSAASMCPVLALEPQPKERILDVASAPGGKTSYIAQLMRNTGVIFANDIKAERQKATVANMHRLGVRNVIACKHDGRKLGTLYKNRFDRVLLDAPCSGLGVISRDPSVKVQRTIADVNQCAHLQKELLLAAIDSLKYKGTTGGVMVYSTCSVSVAENEEVVNYALSKRDIRIVDAGLDFGKPGFTRFQQKRFHPSIAMTRRFYPHVHNMDGFFVAKIQKLSDRRPGETPAAAAAAEEAEETLTGEEEDGSTKAGDKKKAKKGKASNTIADKKKKRKLEDDSQQRTKKNRNLSVPPTKPKASKKQRQNAKTTKPRRITTKRAATDA